MGRNRLVEVQPSKVKKPRQSRKKSLWKRFIGFIKRHLTAAIVSAIVGSGNLSVGLLNRYRPLPKTPPSAEISITVLQQDCQGYWIKSTVIIKVEKVSAK